MSTGNQFTIHYWCLNYSIKTVFISLSSDSIPFHRYSLLLLPLMKLSRSPRTQSHTSLPNPRSRHKNHKNHHCHHKTSPHLRNRLGEHQWWSQLLPHRTSRRSWQGSPRHHRHSPTCTPSSCGCSSNESSSFSPHVHILSWWDTCSTCIEDPGIKKDKSYALPRHISSYNWVF